MAASRGTKPDPAPTFACFQPNRRRGQSTAPGHGLWLLATPAQLAGVLTGALAGDPLGPLPAGQRVAARQALTRSPPLACRGLQRIEWTDDAGRLGSLTFAIGLDHPDRRRLLADFEPERAPTRERVAGRAAGGATDIVEDGVDHRVDHRVDHAVDDDDAPILVIGAGLAGCATAAALARRGRHVVVIEQGPALGGAVADVPLIAQHPALSADDNARTRLARAALALTWRLRDDLGPALHWCGRWQRVDGDPARYLTGWPPELARAAAAGPDAQIRFDRCALAETSALLAHLVARPSISTALGQTVTAIEHDATGWWARLTTASRSGPFGAIVIACPDHVPLSGLAPPWTPAGHRETGQVAIGEAPAGSAPDAARIDGGFRRDGRAFRLQLGRLLVTGAQADDAVAWRLSRGASRLDPIDHLPLIGRVPDQQGLIARAADHARNDRLPYPLRPGLWLATGLGGRGLLWALLAGELVAASLNDEPALIEASLATAIDPARFARRRLRRGLMA